MRDYSNLVTFVLGMASVLVLVALLALAGPRVIPNQLDKCWTELRRNMPNCSTRTQDGATFIRDLRCIRANQGLILTSQDGSGWYQISQAQPAPQKSEPDQ